MIKTKNLVADISKIPSQWILKQYSGCPSLDGQDVMIKSLFNPGDTNPSMSIFLWQGKQYRWNDHSTGKKGGPVDLVMELYSLNYPQAVLKIIQDYNDYILGGNSSPIEELKARAKYKVIDCPKRPWDKTDDNYWKQYELEESDLSRLEAYPLKWYVLSNGENQLKIQGYHIYGYFTKSGDLYQLYQPMVRERKFLRMKSWVAGLEQLEYKYPTLIINSSLKDIAALLKQDLSVESLASDSETSILKSKIIDDLRPKYKNIFSMMNLDDAGRRASAKYKEIYNIDPLPLEGLGLEKDPSDSIKKYGSEKVKSILAGAISSVIGM